MQCSFILNLIYEHVLVLVDPARAAEIATKFFEQHHSEVTLGEIVLYGSIWVVSVSVGLVDRKNKQVKIDAETGTILECRYCWTDM